MKNSTWLLSAFAVSALFVGCTPEEEIETPEGEIEVERELDGDVEIEREIEDDAVEDDDLTYGDEATIAAVLQERDDMKTLSTLAEQADMVSILGDPNSDGVTLFAPTDDAFAKLDPELVEALNRDPRILRNVLAAHVAMGTHNSEIMLDEGKVVFSDQGGSEFGVTQEGEVVLVGESMVLEADIEAGGNVIHVIDTVLVPTEEFDPTVEPGDDLPLWYLES
jgi:uncharacterized surface protein with fasciclin (FAS1) repeats